METEDIMLRGAGIDSFERVERITDVIILGENGGVRRIIIK